MFRVKDGVNILDMLKTAGYSTYKITKDSVFGSATMQKFRNGGMPSWNELDKLCRMIGCEPWDIIEYVRDDKEGGETGGGEH